MSEIKFTARNEFAIANKWVSTLLYSRSFEEERAGILNLAGGWFSSPESLALPLSQVEACVSIKTSERIVVYANEAFRYFLSKDSNVVGKNDKAFVYSKDAELVKQTDELILGGTQSVDCEHVGRDAHGKAYTFRTFKCKLRSSVDKNEFIFTMFRPIALLGKSSFESVKTLSELHALFLSLDAIDQTICRLDAHGELTKEIAANVGLTSRSIENRRKKMQELFQVERGIEIIRITIRLEEHGLLPPIDWHDNL